jgi:hypothetical protein
LSREEAAWLTAATAVTAYRERYEGPDHANMLGARPPASGPGARAAWEHACLQADRYLARRLGDLSDNQLAALDARQRPSSTTRRVSIQANCNVPGGRWRRANGVAGVVLRCESAESEPSLPRNS